MVVAQMAPFSAVDSLAVIKISALLYHSASNQSVMVFRDVAVAECCEHPSRPHPSIRFESVLGGREQEHVPHRPISS